MTTAAGRRRGLGSRGGPAPREQCPDGVSSTYADAPRGGFCPNALLLGLGSGTEDLFVMILAIDVHVRPQDRRSFIDRLKADLEALREHLRSCEKA